MLFVVFYREAIAFFNCGWVDIERNSPYPFIARDSAKESVVRAEVPYATWLDSIDEFGDESLFVFERIRRVVCVLIIVGPFGAARSPAEFFY